FFSLTKTLVHKRLAMKDYFVKVAFIEKGSSGAAKSIAVGEMSVKVIVFESLSLVTLDLSYQ
ncbi:hypothetical protein, partial [Vibrio sp. F13]|uniref:hypothetical protein n=1 Tax=Vibrio sp. F13 TaxID=2070777 RepID=UPI0019D06804